VCNYIGSDLYYKTVYIVFHHREQDFVFSVRIVTSALLEPVVNDLSDHNLVHVLIPTYAPHSLTPPPLPVLYILYTAVTENISFCDGNAANMLLY
jgi:hypothetical protein